MDPDASSIDPSKIMEIKKVAFGKKARVKENQFLKVKIGQYRLVSKGSLQIINPKVNLTVLDYDLSSIATVTQDSENNFNACVNTLLIKDLDFGFDYVADIGINNEIPIYGTGHYSSKMTDVTLTICWIITEEEDEIKDIDVNTIFRHGPVSVSGLYKNEELTPIVSNILYTAKRYFAMWNSYEPDCSKCILNPVILFLTNYVIYDGIENPDKSNFNCSCAEGAFKEFTREVMKSAVYNEPKDFYSDLILLAASFLN